MSEVVVVAMQLITAVGKPIIIIGIQKNPITPKSDQTTVKEATKQILSNFCWENEALFIQNEQS